MPKQSILILQTAIAEETDAAVAKWEHYKAGTDLEVLACRAAQAKTIRAGIPAPSRTDARLMTLSSGSGRGAGYRPRCTISAAMPASHTAVSCSPLPPEAAIAPTHCPSTKIGKPPT